mmetsp:Transcript_148403/g.261925  ORF Transcript_148403/g.261925 Transcript_148403/m.261925 type:complete len:267 (-) Transcript_148403:141-941(-)
MWEKVFWTSYAFKEASEKFKTGNAPTVAAHKEAMSKCFKEVMFQEKVSEALQSPACLPHLAPEDHRELVNVFMKAESMKAEFMKAESMKTESMLKGEQSHESKPNHANAAAIRALDNALPRRQPADHRELMKDSKNQELVKVETPHHEKSYESKAKHHGAGTACGALGGGLSCGLAGALVGGQVGMYVGAALGGISGGNMGGQTGEGCVTTNGAAAWGFLRGVAQPVEVVAGRIAFSAAEGDEVAAKHWNTPIDNSARVKLVVCAA